MSIPIQNSAPDQLAGGQAPLTDSRRGNEASQAFPLSGRIGTPVEASSRDSNAKVSRGNVNGVGPQVDSVTTSGMSVTGRAQEAARPVDSRTIQGSYPGDHRAKASPASLPPNPAVRQPMTQAKMCSSKLDSNLPLVSSSEVVD